MVKSSISKFNYYYYYFIIYVNVGNIMSTTHTLTIIRGIDLDNYCNIIMKNFIVNNYYNYNLNYIYAEGSNQSILGKAVILYDESPVIEIPKNDLKKLKADDDLLHNEFNLLFNDAFLNCKNFNTSVPKNIKFKNFIVMSTI